MRRPIESASAQGNWISLKSWYTSRWTDIHATWLTQIAPHWGIVWGSSTGEKAEKYSINPSLKMGLVFQNSLDKNSYISIKAITTLGGRLKEKTCTGNYGEIGGVQEVNCRLAASVLEPSQTLQYLFNEKPYNKDIFLIQYVRSF